METMSLESIQRQRKNFKTLFHIRRTAARTGPGGPGDLAWIWPVATFLLLLKLLQRNRRR